MTILAYALVLAAGLGWSAMDWARKALAPAMRPTPMVVVLLSGQAVLLALYAAVMGLPAIQVGYWAPAAGAVALNVVAQVMFVRAVALSPLSVTVPYLSFSPAFTTVAGALILAEIPKPVHVAGVLLVVAGAIALSQSENGHRNALKALFTEPGTWRMLVVAGLWSLAYPLDKLAIQASSASFHAAVMLVGVALCLLVSLAWRGRMKELHPPAGHRTALTVGVLSGALALALQFVAMQWVFVNVVEAIKRVTSLTMAALLGHWAFGEKLTRGKVGAIALMAVGVVLMLIE